MSEQDLSAILGPAGHSDYQVGDTITYYDENRQRKSGTIEHITAPGVTASGKHHPTEYWVCPLPDGGFPDIVYQSDVIA